jgi:uncharacterized protein
MKKLSLSILPGRLAVCRLPAAAPLPDWILESHFFSITRTTEELSIVCVEEDVNANLLEGKAEVERGWSGFKVEGPLDFSLTGILAGIAGVLAQAQVSIFAISTFDTDYILVKEDNMTKAVAALQQSGYTILLSNR